MLRIPRIIAENLVLLRNLARGGFLNAAGIGFTIYILAICYPGIRATPGQLMELRSNVSLMNEIGAGSLQIAVPALLLGLLLFARHGFVAALYRSQLTIIFLFCFSSIVLLVSIAGSDRLGSAIQLLQYAATVGCFLLCLCFWHAPPKDVDNALAMAFLALAGSLSVAGIVQGYHDYRWVGLIHPNHYARYAFIALVLHSLVVRRVSLVVFLLALAATYIVSARTVMIGTVLFYVGYVAINNYRVLVSSVARVLTARTVAVLMLAIPPAMLAAVLFLDTDRLLERMIADLAIFDPDRGIGSGFTGRADSWSGFSGAVGDLIFAGYGFRSSRYNLHAVHSGILSYMMDFGILLGGLLLLVIVVRSVSLIFIGAASDNSRTQIVGLGLSATLVIQCFEPDNFNIGFIGSFFFMLLLAYSARPSVRRRSHPAVRPRLREWTIGPQKPVGSLQPSPREQ